MLGVLLAVSFLLLHKFYKPQLEINLYPTSFSEFVEKYADEYALPPELVYAVIRTESSFDKDAVSNRGAKGLMQLMDDTYEWIATMCGEPHMPECIFDPEYNIKRGSWLLAHLYKMFGSWREALAAYNAGIGRVKGWLESAEYSADGKTLDVIPFSETEAYVERVLEAAEKYRELYS